MRDAGGLAKAAFASMEGEDDDDGEETGAPFGKKSGGGNPALEAAMGKFLDAAAAKDRAGMAAAFETAIKECSGEEY